jgi:S1-C subfamily serine protease
VGLGTQVPRCAASGESPPLEAAKRLNEAFIQVADSVSAAVVVVEVAHRPDYHDPEVGDDPWPGLSPPDTRRRLQDGSPRRREPHSKIGPIYDSRGSGLVIREDGWILTNEHVVRGAERVRIRFKDGTRYSGTTWYTDPQSDIAVIRINAHALSVARLGDSSKTRVGELAIAIGAPFDLDYSVTFGHVSAKGRGHVIQAWMGNATMGSMDQDFLQTDASINPGNSGGPLVNIEGQVIGVNTLVEGANRGIGFAIPINLARQVADHLIAEGKFTRPWLGIQITALNEDLELRDWLNDVREGVVVRRIIPDSPASRSGLKAADVITAVQGAPVGTAQQLRNELRMQKIDANVKLDVLRPGPKGHHEHLQILLRTEEWPEESAALDRSAVRSSVTAPSGRLGITVSSLDASLRQKYSLEGAEGVVVTDVERDSPAARQRIHVGDVVTQVNRQPVATAEEFQRAIQSRGATGVLLDLISDGTPDFRILKDSGD